jgi:hypothetical protein
VISSPFLLLKETGKYDLTGCHEASSTSLCSVGEFRPEVQAISSLSVEEEYAICLQACGNDATCWQRVGQYHPGLTVVMGSSFFQDDGLLLFSSCWSCENVIACCQIMKGTAEHEGEKMAVPLRTSLSAAKLWYTQSASLELRDFDGLHGFQGCELRRMVARRSGL